ELLHRLVYPTYFEVGLTTSDISHIECDTEVAEVFCSRTCSDLRYDCVVIKQRYVDRSYCLTEELVALYVDTCLLLEVASRNRTVVVTEGRLKIRVQFVTASEDDVVRTSLKNQFLDQHLKV